MAKPPPFEDRYRIDTLIEKTMRPKIFRECLLHALELHTIMFRSCKPHRIF